MKPKCVIVDAYGPSHFYFASLEQRGYDVIHIQSSSTLPNHFVSMANEKSYFKHIIHAGNIKDTLNELDLYKPIEFIFAGFETGVILADTLASELGLRGNDVKYSEIRTDKHKTIESLKKQNMVDINCFATNNCEAATDWIKDNCDYPIVIKPTSSAGSQGVAICKNEDELRNNFNKIINHPDTFNNLISEILIQPFLNGIEYIVDTVSCDSFHYVNSIYKSTKTIINNRFVYEKEELIEADGIIQDLLSNYIKKILNFLGIKNGATHSEIILTDRGPYLIDLNPRVHGGIVPSIQNSCLGHNQIDLTLDAYIDPEKFIKYTQKPYHIKKHMILAVAINEKEGTLIDIPVLDKLNHISSYSYHRLRTMPGKKIIKTQDLSSSPLFVYLSSVTKEIVDADYLLLKELIKDGFQVE
jgi:biotin carboxylase